MPIHVSLLDRKSFPSQNLYFCLGEGVYLVSSGPLWRYNFTQEEFESFVWDDIRKFLPRYRPGAEYKDYFHHVSDNPTLFWYLVQIAERVNSAKEVQLLHEGDSAHARFLSRVIAWLAGAI